jgi:cephalosporin-C deacetylase
MSLVDLPREQLEVYAPPRVEPDDFDAFWAMTLAGSRAAARPPVFESVAGPWRTVEVFDVTFAGFGGQAIRGWLVTPAGADERLPTIVQYVGYGGGRSSPHEHLAWASAGYAHFVMDTRGQGSTWSPGATPDIDPGSDGGQVPGFLTRGIDRPETTDEQCAFLAELGLAP